VPGSVRVRSWVALQWSQPLGMRRLVQASRAARAYGQTPLDDLTGEAPCDSATNAQVTYAQELADAASLLND